MLRERCTLIDDELGRLEIAWLEAGDPQADRTVLCVHGLTRNAHDFDRLAERLSRRARVISIDVPGRGRSSWLSEPTGYAVPHYARQIHAFLARLDIEEVDWIGTSMGGLVAMALAAGDRLPYRSLVLNDIGPFVPRSALAMIRDYLGLDLAFPSIEAVDAHLRLVHAPFGPLTDEQWRHLAVHSARADGDQFRLHYDPAIRVPFTEAAESDIDIWPLYDQIDRPTLLLRGADSLILPEATAQAMRERGPGCELVTFEDVGHAPALMAEDQIEPIAEFLDL